MNAAVYEADLIANLRSLLDRAKSGSYRAPPVRRVHISKGPGSNETRPIGIPTLEDKVLQRAIVMLLQPIYEQDFKPCSYGFRPGRSAHQALEDLQHQLMKNGCGWILEVDIRKFFDTLDHAHLRELLRQRVRDGVVLRLIGKNPLVREGDRGVVSAKPAPTDPGAARDAEPETAWPRCLLRGDVERVLAEPYARGRGANLAKVACPA